MTDKIVSQEDYEKAIDTINRFRIENIGFFAQVNVSDKECCFFNDIEEMANYIYKLGVEGECLEMCFQIDENTFNKNYLPY